MNILPELMLRKHERMDKLEAERRRHLYELKLLKNAAKSESLGQKIAHRFNQVGQLRYLRIQISFEPPEPCLDCGVKA